MAAPKFLVVCLLCLLGLVNGMGSNTNEAEAIKFLNEFNEQAMIEYYITTELSWTYNTNITEYNQQAMIERNLVQAVFNKEARTNASMFDSTNFNNDTIRQLENLLYIGDSALPDEQLAELNKVTASMETRYATGKVCDEEGNNCESLEPDLTRTMATSRDYLELFKAWNGWRAAVGAPARKDYISYIALKNEAAEANDQPDCGAWWRSWYEVDDLEGDVTKLFDQLKPLYENLHAYVRRKLYEVYGEGYINLKGPIPAHLLGNMWAQSWINLQDLTEPYPGKPSVDITPVLVEKGYTAKRMFNVSDEFFTSLGLIPMPEPFWEKSMIEKPTDGREVVCHASAWDFSNQIDFRIKQCTDITMDDFITIHHEMGHIEYDLQYKEQPVVYRNGANPGFHEAVGDVLALSVSTPKHLKSVGLLDEVEDDEEADLNFLMSMALDKIAFLPFGYLMDKYRWGLFDGSTSTDEMNKSWWDLRKKFQGIVPPVERTEADFDPAAKYHIPADVPYIRYFVSFVIQFQFHEALCAAAGQTGPLYKCDIYQSKEAGTLLSNMLQLGSSKPWPDAMEQITGQRAMDASSLLKYFEPLTKWLEDENMKNKETLGWPEDTWMPEHPTSGTTMVYFSKFIVLVTSLVTFLFVRKLE
ncbi:angiotensin-converting enzyme-like [Anneissia japonica]|uniref:angiotensin-converting enzyme-like n=1 Tax=Anneissia japonica TaxID=1529436 RepID=UPI00142570A4|nr:angiotensin-converting enzyme-like [Anneissia japonica]